MAPATSMRAAILVNPWARRARGRFEPNAAARYLERRGVATRIELPETPEGLTRAARASAERGDDLAFVVGGDGTIRLAAGGLAGSHTALAALPGGTANVWAKESGIPGGFRSAVDSLLDGLDIEIDLGRAGDKPFFMMTGIGWDAAIASRVPATLKRRLGTAAYVLRGIPMLPGLRTFDLAWESPEGSGSARAAILVASNTRLYGGVVKFAPQALLDDGLLDTRILVPGSIPGVLRLAGRLLVSRLGEKGVTSLRSDELTITTPGIPVQVDGDRIDDTPVRICVARRAVRMRVPQDSRLLEPGNGLVDPGRYSPSNRVTVPPETT